jgi:hypothetical protein
MGQSQGYAFDNDSPHAELHLGAITVLLDRFTQNRISDLTDLKDKLGCRAFSGQSLNGRLGC